MSDSYYDDLLKDVRAAYGPGDLAVNVVTEHTSKSQHMPILEASCPGRAVNVAWYGYNFYNHFTAFRFAKPMVATLLGPIEGVLGGRHMSGHESGCPLPDITNLEKDYWNRRPLEGLACFAGGWHLATTLRYLEAASRIDQQALFDVCLDKTSHGKVDVIHGNHLDEKALSKIIGIPEVGTYQGVITPPNNALIEAITLDWFGNRTGVGPASVSLVVKRDSPLPAPTAGGAAYVDPMDTWLATRLDDSVQLPWSEATQHKDPRALGFVPVKMFNGRDAGDIPQAPYYIWGGYRAAFATTRLVRFAVKNPLDAMLLALWWLEAGIPCAEEALACDAG